MSDKNDIVDFKLIVETAANIPIIPRMNEYTCEKHGAFTGISQYRCPKCMKEEVAKDEKKELDRKVLLKKQELEIGERYLNATFDNYEITTDEQRNAVDLLSKYYADKNIILTGTIGSGKTHLMMATIDRLIRIGKKCAYVKYYNLHDIVINKRDFYNYLLNCDFLVIDEFGVHDSSGKISFLNELCDQRWDRNKYTAIITNMKGSEVKNSIHETTYSRLKHCCIAINFTDKNDYRLKGV